MSEYIPDGSEEPVDFKKSRRKKSPRAVNWANPDKLPPHDEPSEQAILGCCLMEPKESMPICLAVIKSNATDFFYDLRHQQIFDLLAEMSEGSEEIDVITVQRALKDKNQLEAVGGVTYLASLQDAVPSAANLSTYIAIVKEKWILRRTINAGCSVVASVYESEENPQAHLAELEVQISEIARDSQEEKKAATIKSLVQQAISDFEDWHTNKRDVTGLSTGLIDLDKMTSGLQNSDLILIGARPSVGKSSLLMNIVDHVAVELKLPVGVFSLEMSARSLVNRMICSRARLNLKRARSGELIDRDMAPMIQAAGAIGKSKLHIDDSRGLNIRQLRAKAHQMKRDHDIKLLGVDYIQLLSGVPRKGDSNRQQEMTEISVGVKNIAGELDIPVIALSQLNRSMEKDKKVREPRLSDLRESGSLEQDSDVVILLSKKILEAEQEEIKDDQGEEMSYRVLTDVVKQRSGPTGQFDLMFQKHYTRFECTTRFQP